MFNSSFLVFTFIIVIILFPTTIAITTITIWSICSLHFLAIVHQRPSRPRPRTSSSSSTGRSAGSGRSTNAPAARVALVWRPPELHIWLVDGRRLDHFDNFFDLFFAKKWGETLMTFNWQSWFYITILTGQIMYQTRTLPQLCFSLFEGGGVDVVCHLWVWSMSEILEPQEPSHDCSSPISVAVSGT